MNSKVPMYNRIYFTVEHKRNLREARIKIAMMLITMGCSYESVSEVTGLKLKMVMLYKRVHLPDFIYRKNYEFTLNRDKLKIEKAIIIMLLRLGSSREHIWWEFDMSVRAINRLIKENFIKKTAPPPFRK